MKQRRKYGFNREKAYLERILSKMRIRCACLNTQEFISFDHDFGFRILLGLSDQYRDVIRHSLSQIKSKKIYLFKDQYHLSYLLMRLPYKEDLFFFIGPYLREEITQKDMLEIGQSLSLSSDKLPNLKNFYLSVPTISDASDLFSIITAFGETIWGDASEFEFINLSLESLYIPDPVISDSANDERNDLAVRMHHMEIRYQFENELMRLVSKGLYHRAESMLSQFSEITVDQRSPDILRNMKNYAVISNTLLRKAAEAGGVHPYELDRIS